MMPYRLLVLLLVVLSSPTSMLFAQDQRTMVTTYSEALIFTPINMTIGLLPQGRVNPGVSASAEYTLRVGSSNGLVLSAGFHPTPEGHESIGQITWRNYDEDRSPVGSFWEWGLIGGSARMESTGAMTPVIGVTARIGSLRESRFGWMGFGYGLGPSVMLAHGKLHFRITMNFGLGVLLGKEVTFK